MMKSVVGNLSGEYVARLKRRALSFLKEAEEAADADLAAFFAEQAMQLYLKAVFYELFGDRIRGHSLRELLGVLSKSLEKHGYTKLVGEIRDLVDEHRSWLILAEEAYVGGRYGDTSYTRDDVEKLIEVARSLIMVLDRVVNRVKLG